jgi:hypothetical protein
MIFPMYVSPGDCDVNDDPDTVLAMIFIMILIFAMVRSVMMALMLGCPKSDVHDDLDDWA